MRNFVFLLLIFGSNAIFISNINASNQANNSIKRICGKVYNYSTNEALEKASISVANINEKEQKSTLTDAEGYFCVQVSGTEIQLKIFYVGYNTRTLKLSNLNCDTLLTIF